MRPGIVWEPFRLRIVRLRRRLLVPRLLLVACVASLNLFQFFGSVAAEKRYEVVGVSLQLIDYMGVLENAAFSGTDGRTRNRV